MLNDGMDWCNSGGSIDDDERGRGGGEVDTESREEEDKVGDVDESGGMTVKNGSSEGVPATPGFPVAGGETAYSLLFVSF